MKISIVRHGETDLNRAKRLMGQRIDEPLNEEGIRQAESLALNINDHEFDLILTSPLQRAYQTATIISQKTRTPVIKKQDLIERDFGSLTGKTWEEMDQQVSADAIDFKKTDLDQKYDYRPYGGECIDDVKKRFSNFIKEIKKDYSDKRVLVIAHGGIIKVANLVLKTEILDQTPDNMTVHEFEI